jgi:hypothetical protein
VNKITEEEEEARAQQRAVAPLMNKWIKIWSSSDLVFRKSRIKSPLRSQNVFRGRTWSVLATVVTESSQIPPPFPVTSFTIHPLKSPYRSTIMTHSLMICPRRKRNEIISKRQCSTWVALRPVQGVLPTVPDLETEETQPHAPSGSKLPSVGATRKKKYYTWVWLIKH